MNKAKLIQKINASVQHYYPWENDGGETRDEYLNRILDEYAQQVSREVAVDFYISHVNNPTDRIYISKEFDKWIKNQQ